MVKALGSNLRQALGPRFWGAVLLFGCLMFLTSIETVLLIVPSRIPVETGYHLTFLVFGLTSTSTAGWLPILATLPFSAGYVEDLKSKFVRYFCFRSGWKIYSFSKILACFLSGVLMAAAGTAFSWMISFLLFQPLEQGVGFPPNELWQNFATLWLYCGLWATVGMLLSVWMESRYIAYAAPFVVCYLLVILHERYFPTLTILSPKHWLSEGQLLLMTVITLGAMVLFIISSKRRLREI